MVKFTSERLSPVITRIRDGSDVCTYLIKGKERCALIDTGYGIGNLKGYVEQLTDKPFDVFITHGHADHASGAGAFSQVYINPLDEELMGFNYQVGFRKDILKRLNPDFYVTLDDGDFIPAIQPQFNQLTDDQVFDLGGITLQWIHVPGHTQGCMVPLIEEERTIMFGDACGVGVLLSLEESTTVATYLQSLIHLKNWESKYDTVLRQHGTCQSTPHVLDDNIENCERILKRSDDAVPCDFHGKTYLKAAAFDPLTGLRLDGREGNILYDEGRIY